MLARNLLVAPVKIIEIAHQLQEELEEYEDECKALYFWVKNVLRKIFGAIKDYNEEGLSLEYYFKKFIEGIVSAKAERIQQMRAQSAFLSIKNRWDIRKAKHKKREEIILKIQCKKLGIIFRQWQKMSKIQKCSRTLSKIRQKQALSELIILLRENKSRNTMRRLTVRNVSLNSQSIYATSLKRRTFLCMIINKKMGKIEFMLKSHRIHEFKKRMLTYNKTSKDFVQYRCAKLLKNCFSKWKELYRQSMADCFLRVKTQQKYFQQWKNSLQYLIAQRQLQKSNECIVNIFRQRKNKDFLLKILYKWREQCKQAKEMRYHNEILTKYANLKSKESLLRKYFEMLKQNCINNKIKKEYYVHRLKRKVIDSLKIALCQSLHKEEKIIKFIEKVECRKYFDRIKLYNQLERKKVEKFILNKFFKTFTFTIVYNYYSKQKKADEYYNNNLLFKSLFTFKEKITFAKKQEYCIMYLNAILPLRRWIRRHRLLHHCHQKSWFFLKKIFREWKLLVIKKHSQKKLVKQFKIQDSIRPTILQQQQFEFDNIMATIAKIRKNFMQQRQDTLNNESNRWPAVQTPSQQINFSYSLENAQD